MTAAAVLHVAGLDGVETAGRRHCRNGRTQCREKRTDGDQQCCEFQGINLLATSLARRAATCAALIRPR